MYYSYSGMKSPHYFSLVSAVLCRHVYVLGGPARH